MGIKTKFLTCILYHIARCKYISCYGISTKSGLFPTFDQQLFNVVFFRFIGLDIVGNLFDAIDDGRVIFIVENLADFLECQIIDLFQNVHRYLTGINELFRPFVG